MMHQGFSASDHGYTAGKTGCFANDICQFKLWMAIGLPAVLHITPMAAYITASKADEVSSIPLVIAFTLDGVKAFHYWKRSGGWICGSR